ncbi:cytochrome C biogenesis protein [Haloplanus rubicundus]|jgi:heme exporter protein B|uniref:Cytochrome C biogenesis protein n=1 Tax=Haloplanus rubicundus TaxID=1547898 RepID=A0A345EG43_9EURY|nr:heme exporter protein CcmB [Haloplanus rubicundus]AXG07747.1 cytochrome C biogenesis protein [Haloplanus rubicundus]AXG11165.1 cytochrome C biogenesis protein [Haloplanus rubicundus]
MKTFLAAVFRIVKKDLRIESRTKGITTTMAMFALLVVLAFAFSFVKTFREPAVLGRGALWIAFVFGGTLGVTKAAAVEDRNAALDGLLVAPVDRSAVYLGKVTSTALFVFVVNVVTLGATTALLGYAPTPGTALAVVGVLAVAAVGFAAVGVVVATLTYRSGLDELALPLLLVPLVVPVLLAGVELTAALTAGARLGSWLRLLCLYTGVLLLAGVATFEFVVEA